MTSDTAKRLIPILRIKHCISCHIYSLNMNQSKSTDYQRNFTDSNS